jgi:hypothetical protein
VTVEFLWFAGCPHASQARQMLRRCIERLGLVATIEDHEGDFASPTILVDGRDVMGVTTAPVRSCRVDLPTEERILAALKR